MSDKRIESSDWQGTAKTWFRHHSSQKRDHRAAPRTIEPVVSPRTLDWTGSRQKEFWRILSRPVASSIRPLKRTKGISGPSLSRRHLYRPDEVPFFLLRRRQPLVFWLPFAFIKRVLPSSPPSYPFLDSYMHGSITLILLQLKKYSVHLSMAWYLRKPVG